jgi:hypothetical protein
MKPKCDEHVAANVVTKWGLGYGDSVGFRWGSRRTISASDKRSLVAQGLNVAGLPQPTVTVQLVERLARHPVTGKLRGFIPL